MLTKDEVKLVREALLKAASRHESEANVTKNHARWEHDDKAQKMRKLWNRLGRELPTTSQPVVKTAKL